MTVSDFILSFSIVVAALVTIWAYIVIRTYNNIGKK